MGEFADMEEEHALEEKLRKEFYDEQAMRKFHELIDELQAAVARFAFAGAAHPEDRPLLERDVADARLALVRYVFGEDAR